MLSCSAEGGTEAERDGDGEAARDTVAEVPPCQRSGRTGPGAREGKDMSSLLLLAATAPASPGVSVSLGP